jgi:hypothetical protein
VDGCPATWRCADVGAPRLAGGQSVAGDILTVQGNGWDIWYGGGAYHYVWQALPGDGSLSARIVAQQGASAWAKAGLMLSESADPSAPQYAVFLTPGHGVLVQYRSSSGDDAIHAAQLAAAAPLYLRVTRSGATYAAYTSSDGSSWSLIPGSAVALDMRGPLLAGLAVTSHDNKSLSTARFDHVQAR